MKITIDQTSWHGQEAWVMESDIVRITVIPQLGAKLVSLFDKRSQLEWLVGPGERPLQQVPYGADFVEQDMSGWDEMFPTIVACGYPVQGENFEAPLPDHGEVWTLPWTIEPAQSNTLRLSVTGKVLPYKLTRTLKYNTPDSIQMYYEVENLGQEPIPFMWAAHPQFACGDEAQIVLPSHVKTVCNTLPAEWGWGEPETRFDWPEAVTDSGQRVRIDRVGPASLYQARKFFTLPDATVPWAGLIRYPAGDWLRLDWDPNQVPYLGLWVDEGRISHESVAALEPMTGFYDSLALAWEKKLVLVVEPGDKETWVLAVQIGTGEQPFPVNGPVDMN